MLCNMYTTDARSLPLHVSAREGCHPQGVFTVVKVVLYKWSAVCSTVTQLHTHSNFNQSTGEITHKMLQEIFRAPNRL